MNRTIKDRDNPETIKAIAIHGDRVLQPSFPLVHL